MTTERSKRLEKYLSGQLDWQTIPDLTKNCPDCGANFFRDYTFCPDCGGKLDDLTDYSTTFNELEKALQYALKETP